MNLFRVRLHAHFRSLATHLPVGLCHLPLNCCDRLENNSAYSASALSHPSYSQGSDSDCDLPLASTATPAIPTPKMTRSTGPGMIILVVMMKSFKLNLNLNNFSESFLGCHCWHWHWQCPGQYHCQCHHQWDLDMFLWPLAAPLWLPGPLLRVSPKNECLCLEFWPQAFLWLLLPLQWAWKQATWSTCSSFQDWNLSLAALPILQLESWKWAQVLILGVLTFYFDVMEGHSPSVLCCISM